MKSLSVLIADDHPLVSQGIKSLLEQFDFIKRVVTVENGNKAFEKIRYQRFDVLFMDLDMPELDGFGLIDKLQKDRDKLANYPKIIVVSVHQNLFRVKRCYKLGVDGYIPKSVSLAELKRLFSILSEDEMFYTSGIYKNLMEHFADNSEGKRLSENQILDNRELELIRLTGEQQTIQEISNTLNLSVNTIKGNRSALYRKLGVKNMVGALVYALQEGWITLSELDGPMN